VLEHRFTGPSFTVGIEEELMILDGETFDLVQGIETVIEAVPPEIDGQVKPELMQSVLEIATTPCPNLRAATAQLVDLRRKVAAIAEDHGWLLAAAGTHPFALWEDQLIVERPRYQELARELGYIARQELIFGTHVHVGIEGPDRAIYIADGIRRHLPVLLATSANSPFWRGQETGLMSSRTPVFRAFPRVGVPPHYGTWEIYSNRVELMMEAGAIEDYTYMWWDVRPHPNLGTVEVRVFDQQTRLDHTAALAALTIALAHRYALLYDAGEPLLEAPAEMIDDNKVRAAIRGLEGHQVDFRRRRVVPAKDMVRGLLEILREDAERLGCVEELEGVEDLCANGTGARRQLGMLERSPDLRQLTRELAEASRV
jgi:glutamate---cysteine ligase / carboxylate-amine ligase